jgi:hypothetical protein
VAADRGAKRVAVIGDVGGHADELRVELRRLGADAGDGRLPPGLTVIQVGDLVHRGPDSDGVVALVDSYLRRQPDQWVQLLGNHEAQYLREPLFEWPERVSPESVATLRRWWADGQLRAAASVVSPDEAFLITHAGLTAGFWRKTLAAPETSQQTAVALNTLVDTDDDALFRAGHMLQARKPDRAAGPIWAAPATELIPGWLSTELPFSQIHGHATMYDWRYRTFRGSREIAAITTVDEMAKHECTTLTGGRIIGIDPGHGRHPLSPWRAWEIPID